MTAWWDPKDQATFDRYERVARWPVTVLSFLMVPVLLVPLVVSLHGTVAEVFDAVDYAGWVLFAADYAVRVTLVPDRARYVRTHLFDLVIVVLWVLPLVSIPGAGRLLRVGQAVRMVSFLGSGLQHVTTLVTGRRRAVRSARSGGS